VLYGLYKQTANPPGANDPGALFGDFGTDALANHDPFTDNTVLRGRSKHRP
jgi:hypothetical protein